MSELIKLTFEQAIQLYQVPPLLVKFPLNSFYGTLNMPNSGYDDGPWPLVAFLYSKSCTDKVTVQVSTIDEEFLEFDDFNPLTDPFCGYVTLNKSCLKILSRLLIEQAKKIFKKDRDNFELIDQSQYDYFHLRPKNHPNIFRLYWRLGATDDDDSIIRLIIFSCGKEYGPYVSSDDCLRFNLAFREFPKHKLSDANFTPLDEAPSHLTLNHQELIKLASVIEYTIDYYEKNPP